MSALPLGTARRPLGVGVRLDRGRAPDRGWLAVQRADGLGAALGARGLCEAAFRWAEGGRIDIARTLRRLVRRGGIAAV